MIESLGSDLPCSELTWNPKSAPYRLLSFEKGTIIYMYIYIYIYGVPRKFGGG